MDQEEALGMARNPSCNRNLSSPMHFNQRHRIQLVNWQSDQHQNSSETVTATPAHVLSLDV